LRIDHFETRGAELVDFGFAVKDEELPGLQAAFEVAAVKKLAGEQAAGFVLDEQMIMASRPRMVRTAWPLITRARMV
jgi:hypothetical protein